MWLSGARGFYPGSESTTLDMVNPHQPFPSTSCVLPSRPPASQVELCSPEPPGPGTSLPPACPDLPFRVLCPLRQRARESSSSLFSVPSIISPPHSRPWGGYHQPHLAGGETEAQRGLTVFLIFLVFAGCSSLQRHSLNFFPFCCFHGDPNALTLPAQDVNRHF